MSTDSKTWIAEQAVALNLAPEIVEGIEAAGYESKTDFNHVTADHLMADVKGLKRPQANRILEAAGALKSPGASAPTEVKVSLERTGAKQQITEALGELVGPGRTAAIATLRGLGVQRVVVDDKGTPVEAATFDYLADGAPLVGWWADMRVVRVDDTGQKKAHHPKTGQPLSKADPVAWHSLDREALEIAAAIYVEGLDAGDSERAVYNEVAKRGDVAKQAARRLAASPDLRRRVEARIDGVEVEPVRPVEVRRDVPTRGAGVVGGKSRTAEHTDLLLRIGDSGEIRRWVRDLGDSYAAGLPGPTASLSAVAQGTVELLERHGPVYESKWWRRLVADRPNRAAEILRIAEMYGVSL